MISLRELLRFDFLVFLGYIYDPGSAEPLRQVAMTNEMLGIHLSTKQFFSFREENCKDPELLTKVPDSLKYFVKDDLLPASRRAESGISISRFVVNTFRDLGLSFIAFGGISEEEVNRLTEYINMLNDFLKAYNLYFSRDPLRVGSKADPSYGMPRAMQPMPDATVDTTVAESYFVDDPKPETLLEGIDMPEVPKELANGIDMPSKGKSRYRNMAGPERQKKQDDSGDSSGERMQVRGAERARMYEDQNGENHKSLEELMEELDRLIGLDKVKKNLGNLINVIRIRRIRMEMGLAQPDMSLHLVFSGNPGTGKTTVARLLAKIYKELGVVSKGQLIEVDRAGLVEGYVGQTAQKTQEVIDSAMGGILFIDEAYTLTNKKESGDFGQEAVDTLLKRMEDDRDSFVVIVAGYTGPMEEFLQSNPGLKSRFNKFIEFSDYTEGELFEIFDSMCKSQDFHMTDDARGIVQEYFRKLEETKDEHFANAREVRNFFERCIERQANRLVQDLKMDRTDITTFTAEDVTE